MRLAYGDLIGGISGDMFVAAMIDLGLPLGKLRAELKTIPTLKFALRTSKNSVHAVRATRFQVICPRQEAPRSWPQIRGLIGRSKLSPEIKATSIEIFAQLAQAEAKIHGVALDKVHFHEVGATDSIVDIVAAAIGVAELEIARLDFSRIPLGHGLTRSQHGPLPATGPATMERRPTNSRSCQGGQAAPTAVASTACRSPSFRVSVLASPSTPAQLPSLAPNLPFLQHPC